MKHPVLQAIKERRSIREFTSEPVKVDILIKIIGAGIWAPSGKNNQPWRFVTVTNDQLRQRLAKLTIYSHIIENCQALIVVYLDKNDMYDRLKDYQAAGSAIQNMLLATEAYGLGAVWLGQILKNKEEVNVELGIGADYELMAVLAIGHPKHRKQKSKRKDIKTFIISTL